MTGVQLVLDLVVPETPACAPATWTLPAWVDEVPADRYGQWLADLHKLGVARNPYRGVGSAPDVSRHVETVPLAPGGAL